jgi:hypothetical protein
MPKQRDVTSVEQQRLSKLEGLAETLKRKENVQEIENKKSEILAQADELAQDLTQKFTNS